MSVPPICDETTFIEAAPGQILDSFDSEVSLGIADGTARVERSSDLDLFPSEHEDAGDVVVDAAATPVVVPDAVAAAERRAMDVATELRGVAVLPEEPAAITPIPPRPSVTLTRRLALVAGILGCLGLPTLGIWLWRTPAPAVAPLHVVSNAALPETRTVAPEIPALLATPRSGALAPFEPTPRPEALMPSEPAADTRGSIPTTPPAAVAPLPNTDRRARPEDVSRDSRADAGEISVVPISPRPVEGVEAPSAAAVDTTVPSSTATPLPATRTSSVNTPAELSTPAPPMLPPAAPVSAPAVPATGGVSTAPPAPARDAADIQTVLSRYTSAFSDLDAAAVSEVWPQADSRSLARAFRGLEEQGLAFENCDIQVTGASATASCDGTVRYVTRVGSKEPRTESRTWQFTLGKVRDLWRIQTVESR